MSKKSIILVMQGGAGDVISATPAIRGFRNKYKDDEIAVIATHSHLLENNPNIDRLFSFSNQSEIRKLYDEYVRYGGKEVRFMKHHFLYDSLLDEHTRDANTLPEYICKLYNIEFDGGNLEYFATPYERDAALAWKKQFEKPIVFLHLTGILPMKSVDFSKINPIVEKYKSNYDFVQIGKEGEPVIPNVHNALGMPMRDTISVLKYGAARIFIESIFAHVSDALQIPSVVIFKSTSPYFFGHKCNYNVWNSGGCEHWPCGRPIGPLNKFLPAYLNLSTGEPMQWMCPEPLCSAISAEEIEKVFLEALKGPDETSDNENKEGPFSSLEEARKG